MDRLMLLHQYCEEEPGDPFNWYALATEYLKSDKQMALMYFETVLNRFPAYLPTYYHLGKWYEASGKTEMAKEIYEKGIILADNQNERNALRELRQALTNLIEESF